MNIRRTQKRILLYVVLPALGLYLGLRLFAQYRPVPVYVTRVAPMPVELASRLHIEEHKISPMVSIETPYAQADDKKLTLEEIRRLRSQIAWSRAIPPFFDSLTIETTTNVVARRTTRRTMTEYRLYKRGENGSLMTSSTARLIEFRPKRRYGQKGRITGQPITWFVGICCVSILAIFNSSVTVFFAISALFCGSARRCRMQLSRSVQNGVCSLTI